MAIARLRKRTGTLCLATAQMAREWGGGKLVGLRVGNDLQVVITSVEAFKELASKPEFDGRPTGPFFTLKTLGLRRSILLVDEEFWKEQRRFLVHHLRDFGWGRTSCLEVIIQKEVSSLVEYFRTAISNTPDGVTTVPLHDAFGVSMLNSIWIVLAGIRYEHDDLEVCKMQRILADMLSSADVTGCLFNYFPLLRFLAPEASGYSQYMRTVQIGCTFLQEELLRHEATFVPGVSRDFMDVYLAELRTRRDKNSSTFSELQLMAICMDMFIAGSDTTSKSLSFCFLHLLRQPQVVKKAQEEMDRVVGRDRMPSLANRPHLPYIEAMVYEALRVFTSHFFGLPHRALADTTLLGYHIPKNTTLVINFHGFNMNEELWEDPRTFRPERFLDTDGKLSIPDFFVPFGLGRRRCIGDTLAKSNLFLFISTLLHTFDFKNPKGMPLPDPFPVEGITPCTQPYEGEISMRDTLSRFIKNQ